jgi:PD-(D/E)XK endonuclease
MTRRREDVVGMSVLIGDLMAVAEEPREWRGRDAAWWRGLTRKRRGEMAEAAFLHKASRLGFGVAKPWGDSDPYDLIVDSGRRLWRVQVKSAYRAGEYGGYTFHAHGNENKKVYSLKEIDVLVAYVVPEDLWYVVPVSVFRKIKSMKLFPVSRRRRSKFEVYREDWEFFGNKTRRR